jgi:DNA-binding NarL/FixJ family response regulator
MKVNTAPLRIFIVDDHPLVREGLNLRISTQTDMTVCGEAGSEEEAYSTIVDMKPDLVIVDISLKDGNGLELIKRLKGRCHDLKMLVVSGHSESLYAERALRAGAMGYLNKQESNSKLLDAIRMTSSGERFMSPEIAQRLIGKAIGNPNASQTPIESLTDRELEVFQLIGKGQSTGAIAESLFLSTHTIDTHRENIKRKLGIKSGTELNRAAVQWVLEQDL